MPASALLPIIRLTSELSTPCAGAFDKQFMDRSRTLPAIMRRQRKRRNAPVAIERLMVYRAAAPALQAGAKRCEVLHLVAFRLTGGSRSHRAHPLFAA
jgi:hypothetical protein